MSDGNGSIPPTDRLPPDDGHSGADASGGEAGDAGDAVAQEVLRYLSGELSSEEVTALGNRLRADASARELFVRVCLLESWLTEKFAPGRREFLAQMMLEDSEEAGVATSIDAVSMPAILAADPGLDAEPEPLVVPSWPKPVEPPTPWWKRRTTWAAAAVLLIGVGVWALLARMFRPEAPAVATLSGVQDVKWNNASAAPAVGSALRAASELRLQSGLVRLTFNGGAKVVVEGPARFVPEADGRLRLVSGRMTALVPPKAKGFTVQTPTAEVVDLGTEFGVDVPPTRGSPVEVQVFDGVVTLQPEAAKQQQAAAAPPPPQVLRAGTGARVDQAGTVTQVPVNPAMFVRAAEADAIERAAQSSGFDRWAAYRYQLARDPDVVAYYPFDAENKTRAPDRLANASGAGPALDGTLAGDDGARPQWVAGRWPEKAALAFGEAGVPRVMLPSAADAALDFSRGPVPGEGQAFTVAAWVKAKPKPSPGVGIVARGVRGEEQFALETESTFYRFVLRDGLVADRRTVLNSRNYVSAYWHHVVATYDPATTAMRLYVDGAAVNDQAAGAGVAPKMLRPAEGPVVIGCRVMSPGVFGMPLDGTVDELVFIRRAITPGEVRQMYEAGKPN